ncbi:MAG: type II toxin-antitoxin system RelE/ParE family toxin [Acidobacteriota bacterium]
MIKSFKSKEALKIWDRKFSKKLPQDIQVRAYDRLRILNAAQQLGDLMVTPAYELEALSGNRKGHYSIRINDQWRICFKWRGGDVYEVEVTDYH